MAVSSTEPNRRGGHGTFGGDRPPAAATIGRESGSGRFHVVGNSGRRTSEDPARATTTAGLTLNAGERRAYNQEPELGRWHVTADHEAGERARYADGVREVHGNKTEGTWMGLRSYLRTLRGVSEWHLAGDVAMFEWADDLKRATDAFPSPRLGRPRPTGQGS